ncbi:MAG: MFS transporter [Bacillota bacterium]
MTTRNATQVYILMRATFALAHAIMFTTYGLYYVQMLGLNPMQLVLVGTALELTVVLFEVPTGVVADAYSRRLSVRIGVFVLAAAYLMEGAIPWLGVLPFFAGVVLAEVIRGVGETFLSGAREAWIADEIGPDRMGPLLLQCAKVDRLMSILGIMLSAALANISLNLPYLAGGLLLGLLAVYLLLAMPEQGFTPQPREQRSNWQVMSSTFREGLQAVRGRPILMALLAISLIAGAASEGLGRLWEAHLLLTFRLAEASALPPATWFSLIALAGSLLGIAAAHFARKHLDLSHPRRVTATLLTSAGLRTGLILTFALAPAYGWAVGCVLALKALGAVSGPIYETWLNQQINSRTRATVLSMMGQADAVGQSGGGPLVGWVGTRFSLRAALVLAAGLLTPALAVYGWAHRSTDSTEKG